MIILFSFFFFFLIIKCFVFFFKKTGPLVKRKMLIKVAVNLDHVKVVIVLKMPQIFSTKKVFVGVCVYESRTSVVLIFMGGNL